MSLDLVSLDLVSLDHVSLDQVSLDHVHSDHVSLDQVSLDHVSLDQVSLDHVRSDHVSSDHMSSDHVSLDHVSLDHVSLDLVSSDHVSSDQVSSDQAGSYAFVTTVDSSRFIYCRHLFCTPIRWLGQRQWARELAPTQWTNNVPQTPSKEGAEGPYPAETSRSARIQGPEVFPMRSVPKDHPWLQPGMDRPILQGPDQTGHLNWDWPRTNLCVNSMVSTPGQFGFESWNFFDILFIPRSVVSAMPGHNLDWREKMEISFVHKCVWQDTSHNEDKLLKWNLSQNTLDYFTLWVTTLETQAFPLLFGMWIKEK